MEEKSEGIKDGEGGRLIESDTETKHWVNAIIFTWLLLTVVITAGLWVRTVSGDVNQACFERGMNDEYTLMEAFFQNPPEQNAVMQAVHACSR
ncbi:hypothetical protein [Burkholderia sp. WAC0059]|uniref:hypothetical protein n=1 Tax=Burkholderia sp. WAC0059 TaxID=2066022 RepID=UPI0011AF07D8|nr:hypothetical protein [Burkholderia sp. WAC0059]